MSHPVVWPGAKTSHYMTTVLQDVFIFNLLISTKNRLSPLKSICKMCFDFKCTIFVLIYSAEEPSTYGIVMNVIVKG